MPIAFLLFELLTETPFLIFRKAGLLAHTFSKIGVYEIYDRQQPDFKCVIICKPAVTQHVIRIKHDEFSPGKILVLTENLKSSTQICLIDILKMSHRDKTIPRQSWDVLKMSCASWDISFADWKLNNLTTINDTIYIKMTLIFFFSLHSRYHKDFFWRQMESKSS